MFPSHDRQANKHIWNNSKQTGGLKLTLLAIAEFANEKNGWKCYPSIETLADMVGVTERQIKRNINQLEESGEIIVHRNTGRGNANIYDLSPIIKGDICDRKGDMGDTLYEEEKVTSVTERVTSVTIKGDMGVTPTNNNQKEPIYIYTGAATDDQILPLIESLKTVTKERYLNRNHNKFDDLALSIYHDEATPQSILGFGKWWDANCYYTPPSKPALKTIGDHWLDYMNGKSLNSKPSSNGHNGIHQPARVQMSDDERAEFEAYLKKSEEFQQR